MEPPKTEEGGESKSDQTSITNFQKFRQNFVPPRPFDVTHVITTAPTNFQVAGHLGFLSNGLGQCFKPINLGCARSRREHLFYQMVNYFRNCKNPDDINLYYKDFLLFINPDKICDCRIDPETFKSITKITPKFSCARHLFLESDHRGSTAESLRKWIDQLYSENPRCPCYGTDPVAKKKCAVDFIPGNYICLEDLQAHCKTACVMDIKLGRITYDPIANEQKILEQRTKYPRVRDFGFRILGMKNDISTRDKSFGKSLQTQEQVFEGVESFFDALQSTASKVVVIGRMLDRLEHILEWFETKNNSQLRFYSSSLLFVYDSGVEVPDEEATQEVLDQLKSSVRVSMIDFAHVFHSHDPPEGPSRSGSGTSIFTSGALNKDDNYLYGFRRLIKFFIMMNRQQRTRLQKEMLARPFLP